MGGGEGSTAERGRGEREIERWNHYRQIKKSIVWKFRQRVGTLFSSGRKKKRRKREREEGRLAASWPYITALPPFKWKRSLLRSDIDLSSLKDKVCTSWQRSVTIHNPNNLKNFVKLLQHVQKCIHAHVYRSVKVSFSDLSAVSLLRTEADDTMWCNSTGKSRQQVLPSRYPSFSLQLQCSQLWQKTSRTQFPFMFVSFLLWDFIVCLFFFFQSVTGWQGMWLAGIMWLELQQESRVLISSWLQAWPLLYGHDPGFVKPLSCVVTHSKWS